MPPTLAELAEDTAVYLLPRRGVETIDRPGYVFEAAGHRCAVHRLRLGDVEEAVAWVRAETRRRGAGRLEWWVGWTATPPNIAERLVELGLVPDDEEPTLTGMTCETEPPAAPHVDVRPIETLEQYLAAVEVDWDVWGLGPDERADRAGRERARFDATGSVRHFAAYEDGRAIGFGRAIDLAQGVALMGGSVLPAARNRGVYRALVHARWEHAAARRTPLLVVQAGHMSAPVLTRLGFESHGTIRLFMDCSR